MKEFKTVNTPIEFKPRRMAARDDSALSAKARRKSESQEAQVIYYRGWCPKS